MKYKELIKCCEKATYENQAGNWNIFGTIMRRASYPITYLLIRMPITPNQVSFISLLFTIIGFVVMALGHNNLILKIVGLLFFVLWNILDCVDGNIARCKKMYTETGDLWDAAAGYSALYFMFAAMGICSNVKLNYSLFIIIGSISGMFTLYPRLLMHFKYHGEDNDINYKNDYGKLRKH